MTTRLSIAAAVLIAAAGLSACGDKKAESKPATAASAEGRAVTVGRIESRALSSGVEASGLLVAREEAAVGSELSGYRVSRVYVEEGAQVRAGQPLAQLDDTLLRAQIDQQAAVAAQSDAEARRVAGLDGQGVLSQEQIESRRYQAKAQAAGLAELRTRATRMTITAPVGGTVIERTIRPGDISTAGGATPWFRIVRDNLVELDADVNEADLASLRIGQPAQVTLPSGQSVSGTIRLVSPRVDANTKLGKVRVQLPVRADLRSGGFGRATFGASGKLVTAVPEATVRYDADGASVVTVDGQNKVRQVAVKTGQRGAGWVELINAPPVGTRVLLGAAAFALDGDKVRPIENGAVQKAAR